MGIEGCQEAVHGGGFCFGNEDSEDRREKYVKWKCAMAIAMRFREFGSCSHE